MREGTAGQRTAAREVSPEPAGAAARDGRVSSRKQRRTAETTDTGHCECGPHSAATVELWTGLGGHCGAVDKTMRSPWSRTEGDFSLT